MPRLRHAYKAFVVVLTTKRRVRVTQIHVRAMSRHIDADNTVECWPAGSLFTRRRPLALTSPLHARAIDNHADHNIVVNSSVEAAPLLSHSFAAASPQTATTGLAGSQAGDVIGLNEVRSARSMRMPIDTVSLM